MTEKSASNFLRDIIEADLAAGRYDHVVTRFPPEPNGHLHIGHAKAICADFGLAEQFGGVTNLRMDDTNPVKEDESYVRGIQEDIRWLGFDWGDRFFHAADYFEQLYAYAVELIDKGLAYVCSLDEEEMRATRGTVHEPGTASPDRDRPVAQSLDLFARMRSGEFADGALTLRAKIDMAAPNMKLRDPPIYRIRHATHHRTGDDWCIYPMYDFAHGLSDSIEGVTHSFCTLEFENNRALYDWFIDNTSTPRPRPRQYEFARLGLTWTAPMSKRKMLRLVEEGHVAGWHDPRMPTLSGLRRRGVPPAAIRSFMERVGIAKTNSVIEMEVLEETIRDYMNERSARRMCVTEPLRLVLTNWPEGSSENVELANHPAEPSFGRREVAFGGAVFVERSDFAMQPPRGWKRLAPGREVRLKGAWFVTVTDVVRDEAGEISELRGTYDPATRGGTAPDGRKPAGTIHWVDAATSVPIELRLYDRLFSVADPDAGDGDFVEHLNRDSLVVGRGRGEAGLAQADVNGRFQFERVGYFAPDPDSTPDAPVFNRVVGLRDTWKGRRVEAPASTDRKAAAASSASGPSAQDLAALKPWTDRGVSTEAAFVLHGDSDLAALATGTIEAGGAPVASANLVANDVVRVLAGASATDLRFGGAELAALLGLEADGTLNQRGVRAVLAELLSAGGEPAEITQRLGLRQVGADTLAPVVDAVLAAHPDEAARLAGGEGKLLGFLLGQVMRRTGGKADPKVARALLLGRAGG